MISMIGCASVPKVDDIPYATARTIGDCPPVTGPPYHVCHLEVKPQRLPDTIPPIYPPELLFTGVGGTVRMSYTIDTTGDARGPWVIHQSPNEQLTAAASAWVVQSHFSPGMREGRRVPVRYEEVLEYIASPGGNTPIQTAILRRDLTPDGVPRTVIGREPRDLSADGKLKKEDRLEAQRATFTAVAAQVPRTPGTDVLVCVQFNTGNKTVPADDETIRRVTAPGIRGVHPRHCPETRHLRVPKRDLRGRVVEAPPGWTDPWWVTVIATGVWNMNNVVVQAELWRSDTMTYHQCVVRRTGATWTPACHHGKGIFTAGDADESHAALQVLPDHADEPVDVLHGVVEVRRHAQARVGSIRTAHRGDDPLLRRQRLSQPPWIERSRLEDHDRR
jgi:hypothetical protein